MHDNTSEGKDAFVTQGHKQWFARSVPREFFCTPRSKHALLLNKTVQHTRIDLWLQSWQACIIIDSNVMPFGEWAPIWGTP